MPIPIEDLEEGHTYVVKMGETTVMTGTFEGMTSELVPEKWSTRMYTVRAARIRNADRKVGVYNDTYTFELAAPGEAAGDPTELAAGFRAVRALRELKKGGRKTKKSKRRGRKTRRTRR